MATVRIVKSERTELTVTDADIEWALRAFYKMGSAAEVEFDVSSGGMLRGAKITAKKDDEITEEGAY